MTLAILLIPYVLLLIVWIVFSLLIMGKLLAIVKDSPAAALLLLVYILGCGLILGVTWYFISGIEWGTPLTFF